MLKTGDKAALITAVAELGYEVTEQDFPDDDFVKLDESSSTMWRADTSGSTRKPRTNMR